MLRTRRGWACCFLPGGVLTTCGGGLIWGWMDTRGARGVGVDIRFDVWSSSEGLKRLVQGLGWHERGSEESG
jgi:hypothetical protein